MMKINNNNKKPVPVRDSNKNVLKNEPVVNERFCQRCFLQLVPRINEPSIYSCPRCNCTSTRKDTYPNTKLRTTFPTFSQNDPVKKHVLQSTDQNLPRSELYFKRRQMERNKVEDPYLRQLLQNNQIRITSTEYYDVDDL